MDKLTQQKRTYFEMQKMANMDVIFAVRTDSARAYLRDMIAAATHLPSKMVQEFNEEAVLNCSQNPY
jgi:hypothetical protein